MNKSKTKTYTHIAIKVIAVVIKAFASTLTTDFCKLCLESRLLNLDTLWSNFDSLFVLCSSFMNRPHVLVFETPANSSRFKIAIILSLFCTSINNFNINIMLPNTVKCHLKKNTH